MALVVGYGNSILFREVNGQLPSFDNTFVRNEAFPNTLVNDCYYSEFFYSDTIIIQVKVTKGDVPTGKRFNKTADTDSPLAMVLKSSYDDYDFYEFSSTHTSGNIDDIYYFEVYNSGDNDWRSEIIKIIDPVDTHYPGTNVSRYTLLEWFNLDPVTARANNNFEMDYSTGITPFLRMHLLFKDYEPKSEISVYDNLDEVTKLKERIQRTIEIKSDAVPRYIIEKLTVITAHDNLYVNEVSFIREEKPETNALESNLAEFSAVLTQQNVIGLNTFDLGFNCDDMCACKITNLSESNVTTNTSFVVPEGYLLHTITAYHHGGFGPTYTLLKFGRGVGDDDIGTIRVQANAIGVFKNNPKTLLKNLDYASDGDTTLYVDISGSSPEVDIFIILIKNRP